MKAPLRLMISSKLRLPHDGGFGRAFRDELARRDSGCLAAPVNECVHIARILDHTLTGLEDSFPNRSLQDQLTADNRHHDWTAVHVPWRAAPGRKLDDEGVQVIRSC